MWASAPATRDTRGAKLGESIESQNHATMTG